jgi:hypothetical protein
MPRPDDEHMNVPVWRMKQLQDVEHAAREVVAVQRDLPLLRVAIDRLEDALDGS